MWAGRRARRGSSAGGWVQLRIGVSPCRPCGEGRGRRSALRTDSPSVHAVVHGEVRAGAVEPPSGVARWAMTVAALSAVTRRLMGWRALRAAGSAAGSAVRSSRRPIHGVSAAPGDDAVDAGCGAYEVGGARPEWGRGRRTWCPSAAPGRAGAPSLTEAAQPGRTAAARAALAHTARKRRSRESRAEADMTVRPFVRGMQRDADRRVLSHKGMRRAGESARSALSRAARSPGPCGVASAC